MIQPYTERDLKRGEETVRALHGLKGFEAWAERIAKEVAAERGRCIAYFHERGQHGIADQIRNLNSQET